MLPADGGADEASASPPVAGRDEPDSGSDPSPEECSSGVGVGRYAVVTLVASGDVDGASDHDTGEDRTPSVGPESAPTVEAVGGRGEGFELFSHDGPDLATGDG